MNIFNFFISAGLTFFITKYTIPFFKINIAAFPTNRGMHSIIKPTGGGIIFVLIYIMFSIFQGFYIPLISFPIALIGLLDDKFNISPKAKFIAQLITVIGTIIIIKKNEITFLNTFLENNILNLFIFVLVGISIINFINFMDGIDGLICGSFIIILSLLNPLQNEYFPLIGALFGFLRFNWQSSKIFMGDTGSLFLGSFLVSILFKSSNSIDFIKMLIFLTPLLIDPLITILRRIYLRQDFFSPHKLHLYQRLVSNGLSHSEVSLIYIISIFVLGIFYRFSNIKILSAASIFVIIFGVFLDKKFAFKFSHLKKN